MNGDAWFKLLSLGTIDAVALFGNLWMILVCFKKKKLRNFQNAFIFNMAFADFMQAFLIMPTALISIYFSKWVFTKHACNIFASIKITLSIASVSSLSGISLQRYCFVVRKTRHMKTKNAVKFGIAIVWIASLILSTTPYYGWGEFDFVAGKEVCTIRFEKNIGQALMMATIGMLLNITVMVTCYYLIYKKLRYYKVHCNRSKNGQNLKALTLNEISLNELKGSIRRIKKDRRRIKFRKKKTTKLSPKEFQLLKTIGIVVITFLVCWAPYTIFNLARVFKLTDLNSLDTITMWLGFLNSALNPLIYGVLNKQFQRAMLDILLCRKT